MLDTIPELQEKLAKNVVHLSFMKINGDIREVVCTMIPELLPERSKTSGLPTPEENLLFWDLDAESYKSCKKANILAWSYQ